MKWITNVYFLGFMQNEVPKSLIELIQFFSGFILLAIYKYEWLKSLVGSLILCLAHKVGFTEKNAVS